MDTQTNENAATQSINWDAKKDDLLLSSMANGNAEEKSYAFAAFYCRHMEYLYGICYILVNRYKFGFFDHDDVFQTTMINAFKRANTFAPEGVIDAKELEEKADAWLGGIAENVIVDFFRRKPKCISLDSILNELDGDEIEFAEVGFCDETQEIKFIGEAIEALSPMEKEVLWATNLFYERREHQRTPTKDLAEITQGLGISPENYRKIRERARKKIKKFITDKTTQNKSQNDPQKYIRTG